MNSALFVGRRLWRGASHSDPILRLLHWVSGVSFALAVGALFLTSGSTATSLYTVILPPLALSNIAVFAAMWLRLTRRAARIMAADGRETRGFTGFIARSRWLVQNADRAARASVIISLAAITMFMLAALRIWPFTAGGDMTGTLMTCVLIFASSMTVIRYGSYGKARSLPPRQTLPDPIWARVIFRLCMGLAGLSLLAVAALWFMLCPMLQCVDDRLNGVFLPTILLNVSVILAMRMARYPQRRGLFVRLRENTRRSRTTAD